MPLLALALLHDEIFSLRERDLGKGEGEGEDRRLFFDPLPLRSTRTHDKRKKKVR